MVYKFYKNIDTEITISSRDSGIRKVRSSFSSHIPIFLLRQPIKFWILIDKCNQRTKHGFNRFLHSVWC